ncbi:MAG: argininosuccinate synthase [Spirochaetes bacterium DG_61]|nr:MAG: argininosuccinate synthase [Spirochaetes bacterium DG_61]
MKKVVLAFSGGLDTSFCAVYLKEELGYEVISVTVDTGGFTHEELRRIEGRAKELGVRSHHTIDARDFVYKQFVSYIVKGNTLRGHTYPLSVGAERVAQAIEVSRVAIKENAEAVAHGSTGAGNDQIRFDVAFAVLLPDRKIITPIRTLGWSRGDEADWLKKKGFPVQLEVKDYSINEGLWGTTIGGKETHDSWDFPPESVFRNTTSVARAPEKTEYTVVDFERGLPVALDGKKLLGIELVGELNRRAGAHGIGRGVHLGDTIMGIKGRIVFEAPAPIILVSAHRELEKLVLSKNQRFWKDHLGQVYGNMLHEGLYFDPVMRDIEAMIDSSQNNVIGSAKIKMLKGTFMVEGVKSPYSLMKSDLATYGEVQKLWDSRDAEGFCKIYGIPSKLHSMVNREKWL